MKKRLLVGITGGIGAGKSIVARIFSILGAPIYDADSRAKALMNEDQMIKVKVTELFGSESYAEGKLNREWMAKQAFHQPEKLEKLNEIVHPAVGKDFIKWAKAQQSPYILKEAALLFEAGSYKQLNKIITVSCPENIRIKRVLLRDKHRDESDVKKIIAKQWPEEKKIEMSDLVIINDESQSVIKQALKVHESILSEMA